MEQRASRQLGIQPWAPHWGDRAWGISVLGRPCHPDWLGGMLSPGSPTLPVCTPHSHSCLPWRSPRPLLSWDMASVHTGSGRQAALSWSLPWHASAQPWAAAQRAAKLAGSSWCFHAMLGSHLPAQTAWVSAAPVPPSLNRQAGPVLPGSLSQLAWPLQGKKDAVPPLGQWPWWSLGQCLEDILLAKSPCWLGGFQGAAERLGSSPGKDFAAGYASCRQQFWGIWEAQDCHSWAWAAAQGWGARCHHQGDSACARVRTGVCECAGHALHVPTYTIHLCVCAGACACGYPWVCSEGAWEWWQVCPAGGRA